MFFIVLFVLVFEKTRKKQRERENKEEALSDGAMSPQRIEYGRVESRLGRVLGRGGFGEVRVAGVPPWGPVAVKTVRGDRCSR